jgi:catechol 2,3-dioxygenase-like lactoylglutathione lyase family enzyme
MITKLSHATIYVSDHDKAYDFYVNTLGFEVRNDMKMDNGFRWLSVGPKTQKDLEIVLFVPEPGMLDGDAFKALKLLLGKGTMGGGVFETDDCQKTYEELSAKGVTFMKKPTKEFYGVEALFSDGCGNWFSLAQHSL